MLRGPFLKQQDTAKPAEDGARKRLMVSAIGLFAEKGYASTSVREIVARAGVTKPVLYYYFKNKEGLLRSILDWASELQEEVLDRVLDMSGTVLEKLVYLYDRMYEGVMEHQHLFKFIHNLIFGPPQGTPAYDLERYHRRLVSAIKAIYQEGLEKGSVIKADPEEVAFLVLGLIDFCFHLDYVHPESADAHRPERLLRLAFQGLGTP
ncbi:MAG: TetR/AcrR family transcriptional regulator [Deltaproteobacteria bacterium]|nr:TetR/AcrR family transcriptional regulator [Deltaproteobacteria bacterium]